MTLAESDIYNGKCHANVFRTLTGTYLRTFFSFVMDFILIREDQLIHVNAKTVHFRMLNESFRLKGRLYLYHAKLDCLQIS